MNVIRRGRALAASPRTASLTMVALSLLAGVINYISNIVFARILTPAEYGDLSALLALSVIAAIPAFAAQTRVAERLATHRARGDRQTAAYSILHNSAHVAVWALGLGVVMLALAPAIRELLSLRGIGPALAVAPLVVLGYLVPLAQGLLQGLERLVALGIFMVAIAGSRLIVGTLWVLGGGGSGGAVAGQAIGALLAVAIVVMMVRPQTTASSEGAVAAGVRRRVDVSAFSAFSAFAAFALLSNLDLVLAKLVLDPHAAGEYAALATIGKIVLFLPSAVAMVMVPRAARRREEGGSASRELRLAAILTFLIAGVAAAVAIAAPGTVLQLMFGDEYTGVVGGVLPIVLAGTGLSLIFLLVVYTVAMQDQRWSLLLLVGVVAQVLAIILLCDTAEEVATAQAAVIGATLLVNEVLFHPLLIAERFAWRGGRTGT